MNYLKKLFGRKATKSDELTNSPSTDPLTSEGEFNSEVTSVFHDSNAESAPSAEAALPSSEATTEATEHPLSNPLGDPTDDADLPDVTLIFEKTGVFNLDVPVDDFGALGSPDSSGITPDFPSTPTPPTNASPPVGPQPHAEYTLDDDSDLKTIVGGIPISLDMPLPEDPDPVLLIPDPAMPGPEPVVATVEAAAVEPVIETAMTAAAEPMLELAPKTKTKPKGKSIRGKDNEESETWLHSLGLLDKSLLAGSTLTFIVSVFFLLEDGSILSKSEIENLVPVGTFAKSQQDVRRKVNNGLTWHDVTEKDQVFEGDSIFTGDNSEAAITLNSGGSLTIDPKSLVVVKTSDGRLQLDLRYGSLLGKIETSQPVVLVSDGVRQELVSNNAELRITKEAESGNAQIQVISGEIQIRDPEKGEAKVIRTNEATTISSESVDKQKALPVTLIEPESGQPIWKNETASMHFAWKADEAATGFNVEIAKDPGFKKVVFSKRTTAQQLELEKLPDVKGTLYWRVTAESDSNARVSASRPRRFVVYEDVPPQPIFPKNRQVFTLGQNGENEQQRIIEMSWKDRAGSKTFKVQISADNQFRSLVFEQETDKAALTSKPLAPGEYWWRVAGLHPNRQGEAFSAPSDFSIDAQEGPLLPPQLENPRITYEIPRRALEQETGGTGADLPPLRWSKGSGAIGYALEVARNGKFEKSKSLNLALVNEFKIKTIKPGVFYWRVTTLGKANRKSEPSATGRLLVTLPAPEINSPKPLVHDLANPENVKKGHAEVSPSWKSVRYAKGYELDWSRDAKFENRKTFKTRKADRKIAVSQTGSYFYRVRAIDSQGAPLSPYSNVSKLDVIKTVPIVAERKPSNDLPTKIPTPTPTPLPIAGLVPPKPMRDGEPTPGISNVPAPKLREPRSETSVIGIGNSPVFVGMKWHPVKGAKTYRLEVSASPDFSTTIASTNVSGTNYFLEKTLPTGKLYWRVRAIFAKEQTVWSAANSFTVSYKNYRAKQN